jgi:hypothetical protein
MPNEIFHFYLLKKRLDEYVGEEVRKEIFLGYDEISNKVKPEEKAVYAKKLMERMDSMLDDETRIKVRRACSCNLSKLQIAEIDDLMNQYDEINNFLIEYSKTLEPGSIKKLDDKLLVSFGWGHCVCSVFKKAKTYEPVSKTFCECCNGHVQKWFEYIFKKPIDTEIIKTIATGGDDCLFEISY